MGVKNLWKLLEPAGRPIKVDSLEGLILAVDVSIWLNQAVKGLRDRKGEPVPCAHLIVLFHRICKLLYYRIKPVFVFDGTTPLLKQRTLAARHRRRDVASQRSASAASKGVSKFLQAKILEQMTGERSRVSIPPVAETGRGQTDMFELLPLPQSSQHSTNDPHSDSDPIGDIAESADHRGNPWDTAKSADYHGDLTAMDIQSESFGNLPPEVQHELLLERQQLEKYSHHRPSSLPKAAEDFSSYQLSRLLQRSRTSKKLEDVRKVLKSNDTALVGLGAESQVQEVESNRIVSSDSARYILVKGADMESQSSQSGAEDEDTIGQSAESAKQGLGGRVGVSNLLLQTKQSVVEGLLGAEGRVGGSELGLTGESRGAMFDEDVMFDDEDPMFDGEDAMFDDEDVMLDGEDVMFDDGSVVIDDREAEVSLEYQSLEGQLALFEDVQTSAKKTHPTGILCSTSNVKPSSPSTSDVKPSSSSTSDVKSSSPSTSDVKSSSPSTSNVKPSSPSTSNLVKPSTSNVKPSSPSASNLVKPSTSNVKPSSPYTSNLVKPSTSDVKPSSPSTSMLGSNTAHIGRKESEGKLAQDRILERENENSDDSEVEFITVQSDEPTHPNAEGEWSGEPGTPAEGEWCPDEVEALGKMEAGAAQELLVEETRHLDQERTRQARAAAQVSNQMYKDAQELLSLFGLPYLVAPTEAEAQCAVLEEKMLTQGSITDDSDIFLFGGHKVYRHFFSQDKDVEMYDKKEIESSLGLARDKLVVLAYLLGSDYTDGIDGVGVVSAMEILRDFPGTELQPLTKLRDWHQKVNLKPPLAKNESSLQKKLRLAHLSPAFPSTAVWEAFTAPEVDSSDESFEWGKPDLDLLRSFAESRMGWKEEKTNQVLLPVLKRVNSSTQPTQTKLHLFAKAPPLSLGGGQQGRAVKSSRMRAAITRIKDRSSGNTSAQKSSARKGRGKRNMPTTRKQPTKRARREPAIPCADKTREGGAVAKSALSASSSSSDDEFDSIVRDVCEDHMTI